MVDSGRTCDVRQPGAARVLCEPEREIGCLVDWRRDQTIRQVFDRALVQRSSFARLEQLIRSLGPVDVQEDEIIPDTADDLFAFRLVPQPIGRPAVLVEGREQREVHHGAGRRDGRDRERALCEPRPPAELSMEHLVDLVLVIGGHCREFEVEQLEWRDATIRQLASSEGRQFQAAEVAHEGLHGEDVEARELDVTSLCGRVVSDAASADHACRGHDHHPSGERRPDLREEAVDVDVGFVDVVERQNHGAVARQDIEQRAGSADELGTWIDGLGRHAPAARAEPEEGVDARRGFDEGAGGHVREESPPERAERRSERGTHGSSSREVGAQEGDGWIDRAGQVVDHVRLARPRPPFDPDDLRAIVGARQHSGDLRDLTVAAYRPGRGRSRFRCAPPTGAGDQAPGLIAQWVRFRAFRRPSRQCLGRRDGVVGVDLSDDTTEPADRGRDAAVRPPAEQVEIELAGRDHRARRVIATHASQLEELGDRGSYRRSLARLDEVAVGEGRTAPQLIGAARLDRGVRGLHRSARCSAELRDVCPDVRVELDQTGAGARHVMQRSAHELAQSGQA